MCLCYIFSEVHALNSGVKKRGATDKYPSIHHSIILPLIYWYRYMQRFHILLVLKVLYCFKSPIITASSPSLSLRRTWIQTFWILNQFNWSSRTDMVSTLTLHQSHTLLFSHSKDFQMMTFLYCAPELIHSSTDINSMHPHFQAISWYHINKLDQLCLLKHQILAW